MKFFSKINGKKIFISMALALSPLIANAENVVKLLMKDKATEMKQDETNDEEKNNNLIKEKIMNENHLRIASQELI